MIRLRTGGRRRGVAHHETVVRRSTWFRLPAEHRAAYLIDVARAYFQMGDLAGAGRTLVTADRIAAAEVRSRPVARTFVSAVLRGAPDATGVAALLGPSA